MGTPSTITRTSSRLERTLSVRGPLTGWLAPHLDSIGRFFSFIGRCLVGIPKVFAHKHRLRELVVQLDSLAVAALPITHVTGFIAGLLMGVQTKVALRQFGVTSLFAQMLTIVLVREVGPTFVALIAGGRAASGITSELATMSVTQQVDALRALRHDPIEALAAPRVLACLIGFPLLSFMGIMAGMFGGMLVGMAYMHQGPTYFFHQALIVLSSREIVPNLIVKPMVFGLLIGLVASYLGLRTEGGTRAVGGSTVRSVVTVTVSILVSDYLVGEIFRRTWPPPPF